MERANIISHRRDDGTILLDNAVALPAVEGTIVGRIGHWAARTPDAIWLIEDGRQLTYADADRLRRGYSARLAGVLGDPDRPVLVVAENGINHALAMLSATAIGIPVAVVSPAYVTATAAPWAKFGRVLDQIDPQLILAEDPAVAAAALAALGRDTRVAPIRDLAWLDHAPRAADDAVAAAEARVGLDTVAKLLFTSGSTGTPKAVVNTHRMMVSNMLALSVVWPFLSQRPPVLVDWLPWNHVFGGNCCFNMALWFGGQLHIDKGRPLPAMIDRTVAAIRAGRPTLYFNVPIGYELLLPHLEADPALARDFFARLDFACNGGAPMPASLRARIEALAMASTGKPLRLVGGWGSTETAPFSTILDGNTPFAANLGVPIPGTTVKMVPDGDRYELRVRGPNVTPGYWNDPAATAAAFDDEGFYRIGDAGRFADADDPAAGVVFDGRVVENFKLSSGTFVNVGALRLAIISAGDTLISDVAVAGEGRGEIGILVFPNEHACRRLIGEDACAALGERSAATHGAVQDRLAELLQRYNAATRGSSTRVARFVVVDRPPDPTEDEITDKGYLNQRRVLARRSETVDQLFDTGRRL